MLASNKIRHLTVNTFFRPIDYTLGSEELKLFSTYIRNQIGQVVSEQHYQAKAPAMNGHRTACQIAKLL